ncbi:MAG: DUF1700 domain-containing protein [Clostridia bacterium]|nr:DUF1700 domain-containing protein [Clostridia bacterium]
MKEQYIRQVKKELHASHKRKNEVARDLNEIFASAAEHGETERQVVERLGTPKEFADSAAESFGVENCARRNRKEILSCVVSLAAALVAFAMYALAGLNRTPDGAIGQADAMTGIQVKGAFGVDVSQVILVIGILAAAFAAVQLVRALRGNRRKA